MKKLVLFVTFILAFGGSITFAQTAEDYRQAGEQGDIDTQYNLLQNSYLKIKL